MARGRMISKSLSTSQRFLALNDVAGRLAEFCQLLYPLIVAHTDDFGRMAGDPQTVKFLVFPGSPRKVPEFLAALLHLETVGLIQLYPATPGDDSRMCLQVNNFDPHQSGLHKRTKSRFPEPPAISRKLREVPGNSRSREEKGTEEKRTEQEGIVPEIDPTDAWSRVLSALDVSAQTKSHFFEPCRLIRETDELIEIAAPSKTTADYLRTQLTEALKNAMAVACPGKGLSIVIVRHTAKAATKAS